MTSVHQVGPEQAPDRARTAARAVPVPLPHEADVDRLAPVPVLPAAGLLDGRPGTVVRRDRTTGPSVPKEPAPDPTGPARVTPRPRTMAELVVLPDILARTIIKDTSLTGPLRDILMGAFEGDWFKAKDCLVFERWPVGKPKFANDTQLALAMMTSLTELRKAVHAALEPVVRGAVRDELSKKAGQLKGNKKLASALSSQTRLGGDQQVKHIGPAGAETVTSDVDVSTGGTNSEVAVRVYNEQFRKLMGTALDPGTVFDLNVYAMDFIHGADKTAENTRIAAKKENNDIAPDAEEQAAADEQQEIYALVHVARFMRAPGAWQAYVDETLRGIKGEKKKNRQARLLATARSRADAFEDLLQSHMDDLHATVSASLAKASSWKGDDKEHFDEGAVRMRAANRIYENKLLQVKELREEIAALRAKAGTEAADPVQLKRLVSEVAKAVSVASLYANEVYGSGGATVHAVIGVQGARKQQKLNQAEADAGKRSPEAVAVRMQMGPEQWHQAFTDNLGDVLKDYDHYGHAHGSHQPDYWYAAFKMGKYVDRMVDAVRNLGEGGAISAEDNATLGSTTELDDARQARRGAPQGQGRRRRPGPEDAEEGPLLRRDGRGPRRRLRHGRGEARHDGARHGRQQGAGAGRGRGAAVRGKAQGAGGRARPRRPSSSCRRRCAPRCSCSRSLDQAGTAPK